MFVKIAFIILCLLLLKRFKYNLSLIGLFGLLLASSPWLFYLNNYFYLIPLVIGLISTKIITSNFYRAGSVLLLAAGLIFLTSVLIIPEQISQNVDQKRTLISTVTGQGTPEKILTNLAENKLVESFRYREKLFFQNFDIGNLFFSNHPRERAGVRENLKLFWITIPFLIIGFLKTKPDLVWFYLGWIIFSLMIPVLLADQTTLAGFLVIFPLTCLVTGGLMTFLKRKDLFSHLLLILSTIIYLLQLISFYV
ncbi:MAG: hypothetical protein HYW45_04130 [Candidatus Daviesbacteria bacterium]|nr:MAG: hypothetical protein HYW45_04130 [Candidatus Daviesbacteria bacterium]